MRDTPGPGALKQHAGETGLDALPLPSAKTPEPAAVDSKERPALVVEHLCKRFGSRLAFDDVSFEVGDRYGGCPTAVEVSTR
jgi:hypothetical protein